MEAPGKDMAGWGFQEGSSGQGVRRGRKAQTKGDMGECGTMG